MSELYYLHRTKLREGTSVEDYEKSLKELAAVFIRETGCKKVLILKNTALPWQPESKKREYDYLWVSIWDKEEHRKSTEKGDFDKSVIQEGVAKLLNSGLADYVEDLGSLEIVGQVG